jgi:hypothetical protein
MKNVRRALSLLLITMLVGACASDPARELSNPRALHRFGDLPQSFDPKNLDHRSIEAGRELAIRYYVAMDKAKAPGAPQAAIDEYVAAGIALVEVHCLRWFSAVAEAQRNLQLVDTNRNVISQVGTALIGIGRLHPDVTAVYGVANTAFAGFNANLNNAFLVAPNSESVKRLTMQAVRARAELLAGQNSTLRPTRFDTAYAELEKLGDVCTYSEVKRLTTQSVDQSKAHADQNTGEILVAPAATIFQATNAQRVDKLLDRIEKLNLSQALALANILPFRNQPVVQAIIKQSDPKDLRFSDEKVAKAVAKRVLIFTANTESSTAEWEATLGKFD